MIVLSQIQSLYGPVCYIGTVGVFHVLQISPGEIY